jgi:hypothetical protein
MVQHPPEKRPTIAQIITALSPPRARTAAAVIATTSQPLKLEHYEIPVAEAQPGTLREDLHVVHRRVQTGLELRLHNIGLDPLPSCVLTVTNF